MRPSPAASLARKQGALRLSRGVALAQLRAQAARWGEHGFFRIEDGETTQGVAYCQLKAEAGIDGGTFSLVLRWLPSGQLQAFFVSGYGLVAKADLVSVSVDRSQMLQLVPARRDRSDGLSTVASRTMDRVVSLAVKAMLGQAAENAEWFQVAALPEAVREAATQVPPQ